MITLSTKNAIAELQAIEMDYQTACVAGADVTPSMVRALEFVTSKRPAQARSDGATWLFNNFNITIRDERGRMISEDLRAYRMSQAAGRRGGIRSESAPAAL